MGIYTSRHFDWPLWGTHASRCLVAARCKTRLMRTAKPPHCFPWFVLRGWGTSFCKACQLTDDKSIQPLAGAGDPSGRHEHHCVHQLLLFLFDRCVGRCRAFQGGCRAFQGRAAIFFSTGEDGCGPCWACTRLISIPCQLSNFAIRGD